MGWGWVIPDRVSIGGRLPARLCSGRDGDRACHGVRMLLTVVAEFPFIGEGVRVSVSRVMNVRVPQAVVGGGRVIVFFPDPLDALAGGNRPVWRVERHRLDRNCVSWIRHRRFTP